LLDECQSSPPERVPDTPEAVFSRFVYRAGSSEKPAARIEGKLQAGISECQRNPKVLDLERELEVKNGELDDLVRKMGLLEAEKTSLSEQISALTSISEVSKGEDNESSIALSSQGLEMEVVELRRLNKELQLEKRNLACRLASVESQLASVAKASEVLSATVLSNGYIWWPITLSVWLLRKC